MQQQNPFLSFLWDLSKPQSDIIIRLYYTDQTIYLVDLIETPFESEIQIKIVGNKDKSGKRESYTINFDTFYGNFKCDCKDFVHRCESKNLLCKHISYLICKVFGIFDLNFFNTRRLNEMQIEDALMCLSSTYLWQNRHFSIKNVNQEFKYFYKPFDVNDFCPICRDPFNSEESVVSCYECHNYVHKECMKVWLEQCYTCVYCRSACWYNFIAEFA
jgi:hypothetical protein